LKSQDDFGLAAYRQFAKKIRVLKKRAENGSWFFEQQSGVAEYHSRVQDCFGGSFGVLSWLCFTTTREATTMARLDQFFARGGKKGKLQKDFYTSDESNVLPFVNCLPFGWLRHAYDVGFFAASSRPDKGRSALHDTSHPGVPEAWLLSLD